MDTREIALPPAFADLEPFALPWVTLDGMEGRYLARQDMPFDALDRFYQAAGPRLDTIMVYLDSFGTEPLPAPEARLFRLMLGLTEAAHAVELFGASRVPGAPYPHHVAVGGEASRSG